jgi:hypothetical protein
MFALDSWPGGLKLRLTFGPEKVDMDWLIADEVGLTSIYKNQHGIPLDCLGKI